MSLGLWEFFWSWGGGAPPSPSPSPAPEQDKGSGGGSKHKRKIPPYIRAPEDFWETRERYLRTIQAETTPELPPPIPTTTPPQPTNHPQISFRQLPRLTAERSVAISTLRLATNLKQLQDAGVRLIELNQAISVARRLELDYLKARAQARRKRRSIRARKKTALLMAAQLLLKIIVGPRH